MATTTKQVTPGFNCRISIFFQSDKNGRKCAYYWTGFVSGRAIRMKLTDAEMFVAQGQADLLPCHPMKQAMQEPTVEETQEPEQVEIAKPEPTKTETRYRVRVKTFSGEIKCYPAKVKKEASEIFSREIRWDCPEENMYVQLEDSGRERVEYSPIEWCDLTKNGHTDPAKRCVGPELTESTTTYTIVERPTTNGIPFIARVFVPGQEVQDFDPMPSAWWMYTEGDLVMAVNKQFKGAWYLKPEEFEARVQEVQEVREEKQQERATYEAEARLETVQVQEEPYTLTCSACGYQETRDKNKTYQGVPRHCNKVLKVDFSEWESTPKQPKTFIIQEEAHPLKANATSYHAYHQNENGTVGQPCYIGGEDRAEVERRLRASENVATIVVVPMQLTSEIIQQCVSEVEEDNYICVSDLFEALTKRGYGDDSYTQQVLDALEVRATSGELLDVGEGFYKVQRQKELQHMEQERQVITVERHNEDNTTIYYHPECFTFEEAHSDNTGKQRYASVSHLEVGDEVCAMCIGSIHEAPEQETIPYPARYTINEAFNVGEYGCELVVCASGLFIMIVQDRSELGGGYGVQVIALDKLINKHLDTIEQVEKYLAENTPYRANAAVWQPLTNYNSHMDETDFLKKIR